MQVGDIVKIKQKSSGNSRSWDGCGTVVEVATNKSKWVKVACSDGVITAEHVDDLEIINESR